MPTTTTGLATSFIQFTRTSNATVTDSDGKIKWAGHNLLTNSESFDASFWTKGNIVTTGSWVNSIAAPNGTTTADLIRPSTSSTTHYVNSSGAVNSGTTVTFSIFVRAGGYTKFALRESGTTGAYASFDITAVSVLDSASAGGVTVSNPQIVSVGSSWFLASITFAIPAGVSDNMGFWVLPDSYTTGQPSSTNWSGDGTKGIYVWGAHLYRSDLGGMVLNPARGDSYYPTTPRNLLGFTEDFSNAYWLKIGLAATPVVSDTVVAPNGLQTADKIVEDTGASRHIIYAPAPSGVVLGNKVTVSVYAKPAGRKYLAMAFHEGSPTNFIDASYFDIEAGTVTTTAAGITTAIQPAGNGWYRCSITQTLGGTPNNIVLSLSDRSGPTGTISFGSPSYTGDGVSGIYLWGAQLSDSASLDAYSPVYGAAVTSAAYYAPRLDYSGSSLAALGLLVEEQRTNISLHSNDFSQSAWTKINLTNVTTKTTGPDAVTDSGTLLNEDTVNSEHGVSQTFSKSASATTYTLSCFAKVGVGRTRITMAGYSNTESGNGTFAPFDLSGGQTGSISNRGSGWAGSTSSITPVGNGWYRCTLTVTTSTGTDIVFQILNDSGSGTATQARAYAGTVGNGCYIYGAQLEAGSFATSYIPTGASTATRTADVASVSTQAFPYSATEGTIVANFDVYSITSPNNQWIVLLGGSTNYIGAMTNPSSFRGLVVTGGSSQASMINGSVAANTALKGAIAFKANDFAATSGGAAVVTDTSGTVPTVSTMQIGSFDTTNYLNGHIRQITYLPRRITNAELQSRTA